MRDYKIRRRTYEKEIDKIYTYGSMCYCTITT